MHARLQANVLRWPADLGRPSDPLKNSLYARAMSALYRDGQRPSDDDVSALAEAYALDAMADSELSDDTYGGL